jgi:hypothetical protein
MAKENLTSSSDEYLPPDNIYTHPNKLPVRSAVNGAR